MPDEIRDIAREIPVLPGPDAPTYWNGEACDARLVRVTVADAPEFRLYWARPYIGTQRDAVEVRFAGAVFYLDDDEHRPTGEEALFLIRRGIPIQTSPPGSGWAKVTLGHGSPQFAHRSLEIEPGSVTEREHEHDWQPYGLDSWRCACGETKTAIV